MPKRELGAAEKRNWVAKREQGEKGTVVTEKREGCWKGQGIPAECALPGVFPNSAGMIPSRRYFLLSLAPLWLWGGGRAAGHVRRIRLVGDICRRLAALSRTLRDF